MKRALAMAAVLCCATAQAQTGVSSDRVSLPDGPGSLEGVGGNVSINSNMGQMAYEVAIEVPQGFAGLTPALALSYSSGSGNSAVGMGWSFETPSIERMTARGVAHYTLDDLFAADGANELVRLPGTNVYRARREGAFVRYSWIDAGTGAEGYWKAEYPDGRVGYFGADAKGQRVAAARLSGAQGTFRYHLVEIVDAHGHAERYGYSAASGYPLLQSVGYVHDASGTPRYQVTVDWEVREDRISDAKPGFNAVLGHRISAVNVYSGTQRLRRYLLGYESSALSGGTSRLQKVEQLGLAGGLNPIAFRFEYSQALGATCSGPGCGEPYLVEMGSLGVNLGTREATLVDLTGDALPDVVDSSQVGGKHRIFFNQLSADGTHRFASPVDSQVGTTSGHPLSAKCVQALDLDGDGFTDLVNTKTAQVLRGGGTGDWAEAYRITQDTALGDNVDLNFDDEDATPGNLRFLDFDNDRKIDILQATATATKLFANAGGVGFSEVPSVEPLSWGFDKDELDLADMNGDGLMDPVVVLANSIAYRLNYGNGTWGPRVDITGLPIAEADRSLVQLEDLNGDGLADIVMVVAGTVKYALNRNGDAFQPLEEISEAQGQALPTRLDTTTVLFADMNGNGSDDVVWADASGKITYLELFPVRPHLLTRIENGLGAVTEVSYTTSVEEWVRDAAAGTPWLHRLPHSMVVVHQTDAYDLLTNVHEVVQYAYHGAYYDGGDKAFRGFGQVERVLAADAFQEEGRFIERYDLGETDRYRAGLLGSTEVRSDGRALSLSSSTYEDCSVAEIPASGLSYPIRYVCRTADETVHLEGAAGAERVTTLIEHVYDGFGNETESRNLGVVSIGGSGCAACPADESFGAPCGPDCSGDEQVTQTSFVALADAGGRWMVQVPYRVRKSGKAGSTAYQETLSYYDGDAFVGLALGKLTKGDLTRQTKRVDEAGAIVESLRQRFDEAGNVVESLSPNATLSSTTHRELLAYDDWGLKLTRREVVLATYALRQEYGWDPAWGLVSEATAPMLVEGGQVATARNSRFFAYDEFGRQSYAVQPGDTVESPTETYTYELGSPVSRVVKRERSKSGGPLDVEIDQCYDGRGRLVQTRTKTGEGQFLVSGFVARTPRGEVARTWQEYTATSDACEAAAPQDVLYTENRYDAAHRLRRTTLPDAELYGGKASFSETVYGPLSRSVFDAEDTDATSPHANTPTVWRVNGLGWVTSIERQFAPGGAPAVQKVRYDEHGNLALSVDAAGNQKKQAFDLRGLVTRIDDPNTGTTLLEYDAAGNAIARTDARGVRLRTSYDAANRTTEQWDEAAKDATRIAWGYDKTDLCPPSECPNLPGKLASVTFPLAGLPGGTGVGAEVYGYDVRGRPLLVRRTLDGIAFEQSWTYDNLGRVATRTFPDGRIVSQQFDPASRLTAVPGLLPALEYTPKGNLAKLRHQNGVTTEWTWDAVDRLAATATSGPAGVLQSLAFTRDRTGNILTAQDQAVAAGRPDASARLKYDAAYRLTESQLGPSGSVETLSLSYDAVDNVTSLTSSVAGSPAHVGSYAYASQHPNAATAAGARTLSYDAAGNEISSGELSFGWDHLGRLGATSRGSEATSVNVYGFGPDRAMRVEGDAVTYYPWPDFEVRDGIASAYVRVLGERTVRLDSAALAPKILSDLAPAEATGSALTSKPDGRIDAADAWLAHAKQAGIVTLEGAGSTSDPGQLLRSAARRLLLEARGETVHLHHDHRRDITLATDGTGAVLGRRSYYPNGLVRGDDDGGVGPYGFSGQELAEDSGLLHYQHRFLDPALMRWTSADPAFATLGTAALDKLGEATTGYAFVGNNPENHFDPTGLCRGRGCYEQGPQQGQQQKRGSGNSTARKTPTTRLKKPTLSAEQQKTVLEFKSQLKQLRTDKKMGLVLNEGMPQLDASREASLVGRPFDNREGFLPKSGTYTEHDYFSGVQGRGKERVVVETNSGTTFYTTDHYGSFKQLFNYDWYSGTW